MEKTFEEVLKEQGILLHHTTGMSMAPLLRTGDAVAVVRCAGRLKKYDVPLYKRGNKYVLHRIIKVRKEDYVIRGDNCAEKEYGIRDADILGVATVFYRGEKEIRAEAVGYRLYARARVALFPLRMFCRRSRSFLGKCKRKLLKKQ